MISHKGAQKDSCVARDHVISHKGAQKDSCVARDHVISHKGAQKDSCVARDITWRCTRNAFGVYIMHNCKNLLDIRETQNILRIPIQNLSTLGKLQNTRRSHHCTHDNVVESKDFIVHMY